MNAETLKALKDSIAHWRRLVKGRKYEAERPYADDCALCQRFDGPIDCYRGRELCPVYKKSGLKGCARTPHAAAATEFETVGLYHVSFKAAANKELEFLKSLLPD